MKDEYVYGVARTHYREQDLLNRNELEQLISASSYEEAVQMLADKGYTGDSSRVENLIHARRTALWEFLQEIGVQPEQLKLFRLDVDFHNLKAALKAYVMGDTPEGLLMDFGTVDPDVIRQAAEAQEFDLLPPEMRQAAQAALDALLQTGDGQNCDTILDKAALETVYRAGQASDLPLVRNYTRLRTALTDIKIAARCCLTQKSASFVRRALAECEGLDIQDLAAASAKGMDAVCAYLAFTEYSGAAEPLKESLAAFEKWSDNRVMELIRPEQGKVFGLEPIIAYMLAVENEMKLVRLVLTGKLNWLEESVIRERIRDIYG